MPHEFLHCIRPEVSDSFRPADSGNHHGGDVLVNMGLAPLAILRQRQFHYRRNGEDDMVGLYRCDVGEGNLFELDPFRESRDVAGVYNYNGGKDNLFEKIKLQLQACKEPPSAHVQAAYYLLQQVGKRLLLMVKKRP